MALGVFVPHLIWSRDYLITIVAVLGTTISPYLFFWQAESEVEDTQEAPECRTAEAGARAGAAGTPADEDRHLSRHGRLQSRGPVHRGHDGGDAACPWRDEHPDLRRCRRGASRRSPGEFAFVLFAAGIIGTGLLALPVLAGSAAYALGETLGWPVGLARQWYQARAFYGTIAVATLIGAIMNFLPIDPIKALFWSAVINGVVAVPIMVIMMLIATRYAGDG